MLTGSKIVLSNAYDNSNFGSCFESACGFLAYSGSPTVGWSNINVKFGTKVDPTGSFKIYDGNTTDPNTLRATYTVANDGTDMGFTSSTPFIYIVYNQTTTTPNSYYGSISANGGLVAPTTAAPATTVPSTTPFVSTLFQKDPKLITHDIFVLVNQRTLLGAPGLQALNSLAGQFVDLLSVTKNFNTNSQSRLGLGTVTPYSPFYAAQGEIWSMLPPDVKGALPQSGVSIDVNVVAALKNLVPTFFNVSDPIAPTRKSVQRSVILFTAWWGDNTQVLDDTVKGIFDQYGVNLAIVGYNTTSDQLINTQWYNYVSLASTTDKDVASFVNRFYLNSNYNNGLANNWCKATSPLPTLAPTAVGTTFTEPSNYDGPRASPAKWVSTFDGQMGRYCNFQDTTYTYNKVNAAATLAVTVYYELEVEQDYLKFYADGIEVESFTGMDVSNAYFEVNATVITARFTTDNSGVQRGFSVSIVEKSS